MTQIKRIIIFFILLLFLQGCLVFKSVSYKINLTDSTSGNVLMEFTDIRSDAINASDLEVDKQQLFQELLKGDEFVKDYSYVLGSPITHCLSVAIPYHI